MNRLRDHRPRTGRPHFSVPAAGREQTIVHESARPQTSSSPIDGYDYTEADRKADMWRSLKPTLAIFAMLATVYTTFLGMAWIFYRL